MSNGFGTPSPAVVGVRDCILAAPTTTTYIFPGLNLAQMQAQCFYPIAQFPVNSPALPFLVFRRLTAKYNAVNAFGSYGKGQVGVSLFWPAAAIDDGSMETYADSLASDLCSQDPTAGAGSQFITDCECGETIEPSAAMIAGAIAGTLALPAGTSLKALSLLVSWEG